MGRRGWWILPLLLGAAAAHADDPVVQNVSFEQRTDGSREVVVRYDVFDPDGDPLTVSIEAVSDPYAPVGLPALSVTGDAGPGILSGTGKEAVWDLAADYEGLYGEFHIRVIANDGHSLHAHILRGEIDSFNPGDTQVYPYWERTFPDGSFLRQAFAEGDTVPHRAVVVFKVAGWEGTPKREVSRGKSTLQFQGRYEGVGQYQGQVPFSFASQYSELHDTPEWAAPGGSTDTLGFLVGPFDYTVTMRVTDGGVIEDNSTDTFVFHGGRPPVVQGAKPRAPTSPAASWEGYATDPAVAEVETLACVFGGTPPAGHPDWIVLTQEVSTQLWYHLDSGRLWLDRPTGVADVDSVPALPFVYALDLGGIDHPQDRLYPPTAPAGKRFWNPLDHVFSWSYEILGESDPLNVVHDGGGHDDLDAVTCEASTVDPYAPVYVDGDGVWTLRVRVVVPLMLAVGGVDAYRVYLYSYHEPVTAEAILDLTTSQLGPTTGRFRARDAAPQTCRPEHCAHVVYRHVRVPAVHGESCGEGYEDALAELPLDDFAGVSPVVEKRWVIEVVTSGGLIYP